MGLEEATRLRELRKEWGVNKSIPTTYELAILTALVHYPELKPLKITFELKKNAFYPYSARPTTASFLRPPEQREYRIIIREEATGPESQALLKNLPPDAQVGVIGHELAHIADYNARSRSSLIKMAVFYLSPTLRKKFERDTDLRAIAHGLGKELYAMSVYLKNIPGYVEKHPRIAQNYLEPQEIIQHIEQAMRMSA